MASAASRYPKSGMWNRYLACWGSFSTIGFHGSAASLKSPLVRKARSPSGPGSTATMRCVTAVE